MCNKKFVRTSPIMLLLLLLLLLLNTAAKAVTYDDLGGIEAVLDDIRELIEYPLKHPEVTAQPYDAAAVA
jgi:hypothetical protein